MNVLSAALKQHDGCQVKTDGNLTTTLTGAK